MRAFVANTNWESEGFCELFRALAARDQSQRHTLVERPEDAEVILFLGIQEEPSRALQSSALYRRYPGRCLVYSKRAHPVNDWAGLYTNLPLEAVRSGFAEPCGYLNLPADHYELPESIRSVQPSLLFSFQGQRNVRVRDAILKINQRCGEVIDTTGLYVHHDLQRSTQEWKDAYWRQIMKSHFVLCPRGWGTSSYRLYEAMSVGRVPVIISDRWAPPEGPNWSGCSIRVREAEVARLPEILKSRESDWGALAKNAKRVWEAWFAPEVRFSRFMDRFAALHEANLGRRGGRTISLGPYALRRRINNSMDKAKASVRSFLGKA